MQKAADFKGKVHVGLLTIRPDEMQAVLDRFPDHLPVHGQRQYNIATLTTREGSELVVAILRCPEQGNGESQEAARDMIEDLAPRWILVVGIAGGIPSNDFTLGDIVVSSAITDVSVEAVLAGGEREFAATGAPLTQGARAVVGNLPAILRRLDRWNEATSLGVPRPTPTVSDETKFYGEEAWKQKVKDALSPLLLTNPRAPKAMPGPLLSSDRLIKDPELLSFWRRVIRQAIAVEMESAGVYRAARERAHMLAIRGISDIVGYQRSDDWTNFACHSAASFLHAFLVADCLPLPDASAVPTSSATTQVTALARALGT